VCLKPSLARQLKAGAGCRRLARSVVSRVTFNSSSYDGTKVAPPANGHHFLHIDDFSKDQLLAMLVSVVLGSITQPYNWPRRRGRDTVGALGRAARASAMQHMQRAPSPARASVLLHKQRNRRPR
jgi:hypothetical protein